MISKLIAGLEAQDWVETRSITDDWRRFGKFGRGASYVICNDCRLKIGGELTQLFAGELWFSDLIYTQPMTKVIGPIREQVLAAGSSSLKKDLERPDSEALLIELLDYNVQQRDGQNKNDKGDGHD